MKLSRLLLCGLALIAFLFGGIGAASAQATANEQGVCSRSPTAPAEYRCEDTNYDQNITGFIALVGPQGEQVVIWCVDDVFQYTARPAGNGYVSYSGSPLSIECNFTDIYTILPGYWPIVYTSPTDGWAVNPWSHEATVCQNGIQTTLYGSEPGTPPDEWRAVGSERCDRISVSST